MRGILTPLVLAIFLAVMIDSFARVLTVRVPKFPEKLALPTAIVLSLLLFGGSVWIVVENGAGFVGQAKAYAPRLNEVIAKIAGLFGMSEAGAAFQGGEAGGFWLVVLGSVDAAPDERLTVRGLASAVVA